jgi:hypothetical protein
MGVAYKLHSIVTLFEESFKCGDGANFWSYVGINTELLHVKYVSLCLSVCPLLIISSPIWSYFVKPSCYTYYAYSLNDSKLSIPNTIENVRLLSYSRKAGGLVLSIMFFFFLAYFPKTKVGLSYHQFVCVCVSVCPPLITLNCLVDFHEIWYGGNAIQGDLDAIIFNPIDSVILKLLRFHIVRWALLNCGFGLFVPW